MGFFDTIEQLTTIETDRRVPEATIPTVNTTSGKLDTSRHQEKPADPGEADMWQPSEQEFEERKRLMNQKPERLSFLHPCPICKGRAFIHIANGGFVCRTCHPVFFGYPVEATGPGQPGQLPDPALKTANDADSGDKKKPATVEHITEKQRAEFAAAWPWIKENITRLQAVGWTRAALFRRSKFRWPHGPWGISWLPVWTKPGLAVTVGRKGEIVFTYPSAGRTITQAAHRPLEKHHPQKKR